MKYLVTGIALIALLSCEKQETPIQDEPDTLNLKNADIWEEFLRIEVDSNFIDTVVIQISD